MRRRTQVKRNLKSFFVHCNKHKWNSSEILNSEEKSKSSIHHKEHKTKRSKSVVETSFSSFLAGDLTSRGMVTFSRRRQRRRIVGGTRWAENKPKRRNDCRREEEETQILSAVGGGEEEVHALAVLPQIKPKTGFMSLNLMLSVSCSTDQQFFNRRFRFYCSISQMLQNECCETAEERKAITAMTLELLSWIDQNHDMNFCESVFALLLNSNWIISRETFQTFPLLDAINQSLD